MALAILEPTRNDVIDFDNPLKLDVETITAMRSAACEAFPKEMCGVISKGKFFKAENISPEPNISWLIDQNFQSEFEVIDGVVHSHCKPYRREPTSHDIALQMQEGSPWGILYTDGSHASKPLWWGDFRLEEPLKGREFIHGVKDCYSAIRSWIWQKRQIYLPDVPRDYDWWAEPTGKGLYGELIGKYTTRIQPNEVREGDVALFQFAAKVPHHAAVVTAGGLMYHHLQDNLSGETALSRYQHFAVGWFRVNAEDHHE